jgi:hypothetical protein
MIPNGFISHLGGRSVGNKDKKKGQKNGQKKKWFGFASLFLILNDCKNSSKHNVTSIVSLVLPVGLP